MSDKNMSFSVNRWPEFAGNLPPNAFKDVFKFVQGDDDSVFDVSSSGSELSDPFQVVNKHIQVVKTRKRRKSKLKTDWLLMSQFSDDYKETMSEIRRENDIEESMMIENNEQVREHAKSHEKPDPTPQEVIDEAADILKDVNIKSIPKPTLKTLKDRPSSPDQMDSGIWRMLSTQEKFIISPPGYDAFDSEVPHWMKQPEIPLEIRESARNKCLNWLTKQIAK